MKRPALLFIAGTVVFPPISGMAAAAPDTPTTPLPEAIAVLNAPQPRADMNCELFPEAAVLGMDMKFHAGYEISLSLREFQGTGNYLISLFRVVPKDGSHQPVYFIQKSRVPAFTATSGTTSLFGGFALGEGFYHVDWLIHDANLRFCSAHWDIRAALSPKEKKIAIALPPGVVRPSEIEAFQPEPPFDRDPKGPRLHVKVLVNVAPERPDSASLTPPDRIFLLSILRNLARDPRVGRISLVAFNAQHRKILYRQEASGQIDIPAIGEAVKQLKLGTVDVSVLKNKNGDVEFLSGLVKDEIAAGTSDGLVFAGPKSQIDACIRKSDLNRMGKPEYPVFNMTYSVDPDAYPWPDAIGRLVRFFKGHEYMITGPRELWYAISDAVGRMESSRKTASEARLSEP